MLIGGVLAERHQDAIQAVGVPSEWEESIG